MLDKRLKEHMRYYINAEVATLIAESRKISSMDGLRVLLDSKTYRMQGNDGGRSLERVGQPQHHTKNLRLLLAISYGTN